MQLNVPPISNLTQITTRSHHDLQDLTINDDHTQYDLLSGNRTLSGNKTYTGQIDMSGASEVLVPTPTTSGQAVTKEYADSLSPVNLQSIIVFDEACVANDPITISDGTISVGLIESGGTLSGGYGFGTSGTPEVAMKVVVGASSLTISSITCYLEDPPLISNNFKIYLEADSSGVPSGTALVTATLLESNVGSGMTLVTISFSSAQLLAANTIYWIVFGVDSLYSSSMVVGGSSSSNLNGATYNGTTWTTGQSDIWYKLNGTSIAGHAIIANSSVAGRASGFIGFSVASVSSHSSGSVATDGKVTGFSGLSIGKQYYLNDAAGTIGTSAGTVSRKVGIALSSTTLIITNVW